MKISVVIPLFNKYDSIERALHSIQNQTVQPYEIVVVNDGSTDGSEKLIEKLNNPLIRLINQSNAGVSVARNKGIEEAKGDWIAFLDADDEWKPDFLESMQTLAITYPQCKVSASTYEFKDYQGKPKTIILRKIPFKSKIGLLTNYFEVASCSHPPLWSSAIMIKKEALIDIGGFPVGIKSGEDLLTWARLAVKHEIAYTLIALSVFHLDKSHEITQKPTRVHDKKDMVGKELIKLYQSFNQPYLKKYISHWYKMRASVCLRLNERRYVLKYAIKSLNYNILNFKVYLFLLMILLPRFLQDKIKQVYQS